MIPTCLSLPHHCTSTTHHDFDFLGLHLYSTCATYTPALSLLRIRQWSAFPVLNLNHAVNIAPLSKLSSAPQLAICRSITVSAFTLYTLSTRITSQHSRPQNCPCLRPHCCGSSQLLPSQSGNLSPCCINISQAAIHFILYNNLAPRIVDSPSFWQLVEFLNPTTKLISHMTLKRDLKLEFDTARGVFQAELQLPVSLGGRICLTTDAWSACNYKQYAAMTVHWIDGRWELRLAVLDVVHL